MEFLFTAVTAAFLVLIIALMLAATLAVVIWMQKVLNNE